MRLQGQGHFGLQEDNLNKFDRGPPDDATYQISSIGLVV